MKKTLIVSSIAFALIVLTSWGPEGHSTIALIAQNHLTPNAQKAVSTILNGEPMSSISSWADDYRPTHPETEGWHFLNLELGLNPDQFKQVVTSQQTANVYNKLNFLINEISNASTPAPQKLIDLKFIVHFVGDAHQPMHISRREDRGGGLIHVTYHNNQTNLHKVWDGLLLKDDQSNFTLLAKKVDHATPAQIQQWQSDDMVKWLWESYQISSKIYSEVHNGSSLGQSYYTAHIPTAEMRLEMGGIRLAGVLNRIFK